MVVFERLTRDIGGEFDWMYDLYTISFPEHEQRTRDGQRLLQANAEYPLDLVKDGTARAGVRG